MGHRCVGRKFGRLTAHRTSMMRNLAISLIRHESISTTLPKSKDLRPFVEKLITKAKNGSLASRRLLISRLGNVPEVGKLIDDIAKRFEGRNGGYTRIVKVGHRQGDCADMSIIQFV